MKKYNISHGLKIHLFLFIVFNKNSCIFWLKYRKTHEKITKIKISEAFIGRKLPFFSKKGPSFRVTNDDPTRPVRAD